MAAVKQSKRVQTDSNKNDLADFIDTSRRDLDAQIGPSAVRFVGSSAGLVTSGA
jgi:hypothetical protein